MTVTLQHPVRVFISYSHDSADHAQRVLDLALRLCKEGIDCHLDRFETSPPEGWPAWMRNRIDDSDFVLVVCSETYLLRVTGRETEGKGLGARWEGAIVTQSIYLSGGLNSKFIPVVFGAGDVAFIPPFLASATRYDASSEQGYDSLYRRLTNQPAVVKPPIGTMRRLESATKDRPAPQFRGRERYENGPRREFILFASPKGEHRYFVLREVEIAERIVVDLESREPGDSAYLSDLRRVGTASIGVAFGDTALMTYVESVRQVLAGGAQNWEIVLRSAESSYGTGITEPGTTNFSADRLAELRARRILLNEPAPTTGGRNDAMIEILIRGLNTPLQVPYSPLPFLVKGESEDNQSFLAQARLLAILWLRLSGTVEHVLNLEMRLVTPELLDIAFEGRRHRRYANEEPAIIQVSGQCDLTRKSHGASWPPT